MSNNSFPEVNGSNFKVPLTVNDLVLLEKVKVEAGVGFVVDLNPIREITESLKSLMQHGLVRIDIFQDNEKDYFAFDITKLGNEKLNDLDKLLTGK